MSRDYQLTRETKRLLNENRDFFGAANGVTEELGLKIPPGDPEAHTEVTLSSSGDIEVLFVYPVDNNTSPADGRIYLKDRFVFDPKEEKLKSFQRQFDFNDGGKGDSRWKEWAEKYRKATGDLSLEKLDDRQREMAVQIGRSFGRPIHRSLSRLITAKQEYFLPVIAAANEINPSWKFRKSDPQSHFTIVPQAGKLLVTLAFPLDDDKDPSNGRLFFYEKFTLDAKTQQLEKVEREWRVPNGLPEGITAQLKDAAGKLNQLPAPDFASARAFIEGILPETLRPLPPHFELVDGKVPLTPDTHRKGFSHLKNAWDRGGLAPQDKSYATDRQVLLAALEKEIGEKKAAQGKGWARPALNLLSSGGSLAEADLKSDPAVRKLAAILDDPNPETRAAQLLNFVRRELLTDQALPHTALQVVEHLGASEITKKDPKMQAELKRLVQTLDGSGSVGTKFEFLLPKFTDDVASPSMLLAMGLAPFSGVAAEVGVIRILKGLRGTGRLLAETSGLLVEAAAFTGLHRQFSSATYYDPKAMRPFSHEFLGAALLFGFTRLAHGGTNLLIKRGSKTVWATEGELTHQFLASSSGRIAMTPVYGRQLSQGWARFAGLLHHGSGIGAMYAAGQVSQWQGWQPKNSQGTWGDLFDAAWMYTHAMVGFSLADRLTEGGLYRQLLDAKLRAAGQHELPAPPIKLDPTDDAVGKGVGNLLIERFAREKLTHLRTRLHEVKGERDGKIAEAAGMANELDAAKEANLSLTTKNADLESRVGEVFLELEELRGRQSAADQKLKGAKNDLEDAEKNLKEKEIEVDNLREQVAREIERARKAEMRVSVMEPALEGARGANKNFEDGFKKLAEGGKEEALSKFREGLESANRQVEALSGDLEKRRQEIDELQEKVREAEERQKRTRKELEEARAEIVRIQSESSVVRKRAEFAEAGAEALQKRAEATEQTNASMRADLEQSERNKADLERRADEAEKRAGSAEKRSQELQTQIASLNSQVEGAQQRISQELTAVSTQIQELENEIFRLKDANQVLEREKKNAEARVERVEKEKDETAKLQGAWLTEADRKNEEARRKTAQAIQQLEEARAKILQLEQQLAAEPVEDIEEDRPTIPIDLNAARAALEEEPETLRPPPPEASPALPVVPALRPPPPPIVALPASEVNQKLLKLARAIAKDQLNDPASQAQYAAGEAIPLKFTISIAHLEIVAAAAKGTFFITLNLDPVDGALHLLPDHKDALVGKLKDPRPIVAKLYQAILSLDGKALAEGAPVQKSSVADFDDIPTEPRGFVPTAAVIAAATSVPLPGAPSDATPAAGVDSPPSAHVESVGVAPGGEPPRQPPVPPAPPAGEEEDPDSSRLPTRPMAIYIPPEARAPKAEGEPVELDVEEAELLFSPPHFDLSEPKKQGTLAGLAPIEIRKNEKKIDGSPLIQEVIAEFGELAGVTDEGRGYKDQNEDSIGRAFGPDGLTFGVVDGAGGAVNGKAASQLIIDTVLTEITNGMSLPGAMDMANAKAFGAFGGRSYATAIFTQILPPFQAGQPFRAKHHWAGDSSALQLRRVRGKWQIVFRTKEDNVARQMVDANPNRDEESVNRTLQIHVHPRSNLVSNAIGLQGMEVRSIEDGEISTLAAIETLPDGTKAIVAEDGDLFLDFSDGLGDNFGQVQKILDLIEGAATAEEAVKILHAESHHRMELLKDARERLQTQFNPIFQAAQGVATPMALQWGRRISFSHEGETWWVGQTQEGFEVYTAEEGNSTFWNTARVPVDYNGAIFHVDNDGTAWNLPTGGKPVDHFKTDNFGLVALLFKGGSLLRLPPRLTPPPLPPPSPPPPPSRRASPPPLPVAGAAPVWVPPPPPPVSVPAAVPVVPPPLPVPAGRAALVQGRVWFLDPRYPKIFGRSPDDGVALGDPNLSKNHFLLTWELGTWQVKDLRSHNSTSLNGDVLQGNRAYPLGDGDWIRAGAHQFQFHRLADNTAALARPYAFTFSKHAGSSLLGSGANATHPIFDSLAAEQHAEIFFNGTHWLIRDKASRTGTRINGTQIMDPRGQVGSWRPLNNGDLVAIGNVQLQCSFTGDGDLRLSQIIQRPSAQGPEITPGMARIAEERREQLNAMNNVQAPKGPPQLDGNQLKMGNARILKVRNTTKEPGRFYLDDGEVSSYTLSMKQVMMFEDDLFLIEQAGPQGFKITNQELRKGLRIHNSRGKDILLPRKGSDYAQPGDTLTFGEFSFEIRE